MLNWIFRVSLAEFTHDGILWRSRAGVLSRLFGAKNFELFVPYLEPAPARINDDAWSNWLKSELHAAVIEARKKQKMKWVECVLPNTCAEHFLVPALKNPSHRSDFQGLMHKRFSELFETKLDEWNFRILIRPQSASLACAIRASNLKAIVDTCLSMKLELVSLKTQFVLDLEKLLEMRTMFKPDDWVMLVEDDHVRVLTQKRGQWISLQSFGLSATIAQENLEIVLSRWGLQLGQDLPQRCVLFGELPPTWATKVTKGVRFSVFNTASPSLKDLEALQ